MENGVTGASLALVRAHVAQVPLPKQGHVTRLFLSLEEHTAAAVLLKWYTAPHAQVRFKTIKKFWGMFRRRFRVFQIVSL